MDDARQRKFLSRVRSALDPLPSRPDPFAPGPSEKSAEVLERIKKRTAWDYQDLFNRLTAAAAPLNLEVVASADTTAVSVSIAHRIQDTLPEPGTGKSIVAWKHPLVEDLQLAASLADQNVPVLFVEPGDDIHQNTADGGLRRRVAQACMGVTSADFCLADTATLVMKTRPGQPRSVSLVPTIHAAVIKRSQLLADLGELYTVLDHHPDHRAEGLTNCMTFITGPSKTADIEMTLVHGVHGPREVVIYVIDS